jgi:hypothetical protein
VAQNCVKWLALALAVLLLSFITRVYNMYSRKSVVKQPTKQHNQHENMKKSPVILYVWPRAAAL